jgi:hypothetical protein
MLELRSEAKGKGEPDSPNTPDRIALQTLALTQTPSTTPTISTPPSLDEVARPLCRNVLMITTHVAVYFQANMEAMPPSWRLVAKLVAFLGFHRIRQLFPQCWSQQVSSLLPLSPPYASERLTCFCLRYFVQWRKDGVDGMRILMTWTRMETTSKASHSQPQCLLGEGIVASCALKAWSLGVQMCM